jgi:hypothetical protein
MDLRCRSRPILTFGLDSIELELFARLTQSIAAIAGRAGMVATGDRGESGAGG